MGRSVPLGLSLMVLTDPGAAYFFDKNCEMTMPRTVYVIQNLAEAPGDVYPPGLTYIYITQVTVAKALRRLLSTSAGIVIPLTPGRWQWWPGL